MIRNEIKNPLDMSNFIRKLKNKSKSIPISPRMTVKDQYQPIQGDLKNHKILTG